MKLKLLCAIVCVSALLADVNMDDLAKEHIKAMRADGSITSVLNMFIADGTFCKVRGHLWGSHVHVTLEYSPNRIGCRECKVCGLHQEQQATEWK